MNSKTTHCGVGLLAADMQVMATFYRDVLGLEIDWDGGNFEIGLWLPAFADVDAEYEKLRAKDVAVPADGPIPCPSVSAISTLPTRRAICWRSAATRRIEQEIWQIRH